MSTFVLSLLLLQAPAPAPTHTELHPRHADLYVEVPDVPAVLDAYRSAPLLRFLQDDRSAALVAQLGVGSLVRSKTPVRDAITRLVDDLVVGDGVEPAKLVNAVKHMSFSATSPDSQAGSGDLLLVLDLASEAAAGLLVESLLSRATEQQPLASKLDGSVALRIDPVSTPLWMARENERVFIGGGAMAPNDLAERRADKSTSLASNERMKHASKMFVEARGTTILWLFQTQNALRTVRALDQDFSLFGGRLGSFEMLTSLPIDPLAGERVVRMQLEGARFVSETFVAGIDTNGAKATSDAAGLDASSMDRAPAGVMLVWASNLVGDLVAPILSSLASAGVPDKELAPLRETAAMFGSRMQGYAHPISGLGLPKLFAWIDLRSGAEGVQKRLAEFCDGLGETMPGVSARTRDYSVRNRQTGDRRAFPLTTVTVPPELLSLGPFFTISPAFAVVDGRLLVGLRSTDVKGEIKRLFGGLDGGERPDALLARLSDESAGASTIVLVDWNAQVHAALALVKTLAPLLGQSSFNLDALPSSASITEYFEPTVHVGRPVEGGTYSHHVASFGPETWLAITRGVLTLWPGSPEPNGPTGKRDESSVEPRSVR